MGLTLNVGMFESLNRGDPLGLVETEKFPEKVDPLTGDNADWGSVALPHSGSQTFTDLGQV